MQDGCGCLVWPRQLGAAILAFEPTALAAEIQIGNTDVSVITHGLDYAVHAAVFHDEGDCKKQSTYVQKQDSPIAVTTRGSITQQIGHSARFVSSDDQRATQDTGKAGPGGVLLSRKASAEAASKRVPSWSRLCCWLDGFFENL